jgi:hypothetical protein
MEFMFLGLVVECVWRVNSACVEIFFRLSALVEKITFHSLKESESVILVGVVWQHGGVTTAALTTPNVMCAAKAATQSGACNLIWASNTPKNGLQSTFQAIILGIYPAIKIP